MIAMSDLKSATACGHPQTKGEGEGNVRGSFMDPRDQSFVSRRDFHLSAACVGFTRRSRSMMSFCTHGRGCRSPFFHAYTMRSGQSSISAIFAALQGSMALVKFMRAAKRNLHKVQDCCLHALHNVHVE